MRRIREQVVGRLTCMPVGAKEKRNKEIIWLLANTVAVG
jgi:hypothetical protein